MITAEDLARQGAIADYQLVGAPSEPDLESLVQLAALVCGVSTAVINIIDNDFQHQVAAIGFEPNVCAREDSMCAVVLGQAQHVLVPDAREDPRFADNPFVTGEIGHVRLYASSPVITPSGIPIGTVCVFDEEPGTLTPEQSHALDLIAHQVVDVLELRRTASELARSNDQLTSFASQVSHDLKNPLSAISGFIELAAEDPDIENAPFAIEALARAESAANRMTTMVTDLLEFARVDGTRPHLVEVDLNSVVKDVVDDLHAAISDSGATVTVHAAITPIADPTLIAVLLQNLVANAIKFSRAAGFTPRVDVSAHDLSDGWQITVDDNGPGVNEEDRTRVFEKMRRGSTHGTTGLGIGLATCRRIVQAHGGGIGIESSPLGGTRVWVALPAQPK